MTLLNNTPGGQWEALNVKRPASAYVEKRDKVATAQKALGLAQLALSIFVFVKGLKKK
jgi:hypothetical protein